MKAKEKIMIGINVIVLIFVTIALMISTSMGEIISFLNVGKQLAGGEELSFNLIASPEEARVKAGDTVTITLSVADISMGKTGLNSIVGNLEYDEDLFDEMTIEGNKNGEGQADWQIELNQIENHALYGKFCIYAIEEGVTENQDVVTMTLKLKSDLKPQTTEVKFLDLQSSDGNVAVDEQERIVKIIIYDEEPRPEQPEVLPEEPEKVPEGTVQTGDQVIVIAIIVIAVTILANILVFVKNKKAKTISIIVVILLGLLSICITVFAKNIDQDIMDKISKNESWLNSEKYLVTDVDISRIAPNSKIEQIKNNFNKEIKIYESTKDEQNVENLSEKTTGTVTTGMLIKTDDEENNYYVSVVGDLDRDGESNQVELTTIIRNTINSAKWGFTGIQAKSADMKLDGEIDEKDITASVRYIVYGELEIPGFEQVKAPILEIVEGTFNEHIDAYEDTIKIKVTEQEENAEKTVYKIVGTTDTEYTEITSGDVVTLEENGTYKILAYTYGKLGNRSEISTIIVNKDKATADYTIEYYKDDILMDTYEAEARIASTIETYPDKTPDGYRLGNVENKPLTITSDARANVMKVYYVKDNFDYSIEYYYDGQIDSTKTETGNAEFASTIDAYEDKVIDGYRLDNVENKPLTITSDATANVMKVYYVKDNFDYSIEYYYDGQIDNTKTATGNAEFASTIDTYEDKIIDGYRLDNVENKPLTITSDATANVMKVYYVKDNFDYRIEYYYDGQIDRTKTATGTAEFASTIDTYEDKVIPGYELDLAQGTNGIDGIPLTISSNENENVIKVYYKATIYSLTYVLNDGTLETENPSTYKVTDESFTLNNPTKPGYTSTGWTLTKLNGQEQPAEIPNTTLTIEKGTTGDREYTANWIANTDTAYTVEHYLENLDGTYKLEDTIPYAGETDKEVTAEPNTYTGFTLDLTNENTKQTGKITADGKLVLKLYYRRNTYTLTLIAGENIASVNGAENSVSQEYKYEQEIDITAEVEQVEGHTTTFTMWESNEPSLITSITEANKTITMPLGDVTLTAQAERVVNEYAYRIEYYYDGQIDSTKTTTGNAEFASTIDTYEDKIIDGYRLGNVENKPLTITLDATANVMKVYYVKDNFDYSIEYYYDGQIDSTKTETGNAEFASTIDAYENKVIDGYRLGNVENKPLTITSDATANVMKVYYVKDNFDYTIEYYYDGQIDSTKTETGNAEFASTIDTYEDKIIDGYRLGNVENKPLTITSDATANVMKVYYVKDNFDYSIEYYYDGQIDNTKTETLNAEFATVILASDLTTKIETNKIAGYELDLAQGTNGIDGTPLTIGSNENENVIKVYYKATIYSLTYVLNDGTLEIENPSTYKVTDESFTLNNPTKPGYTFTGWTLTKLNVQEQPAGTPNTTLTIEKGTTGDREYTANWIANTDTGYTVEHYTENLDGTYKLEDTIPYAGETDTEVTAESNTYTGFTLDLNNENTKQTGKITADGKLVLKLYYRRNTYTLTLIAGENIASVNGAENSVSQEYKYEQEIDITAEVEQVEGHTTTFTMWESNEPGLITSITEANKTITMPLGDVTLTAQAERVVNEYAYRIEYYYDGQIDRTKTATGTAEFASTIDTYEDKVIPGYELDLAQGTNGIDGIPLTISSNENENVIKVYYKATIYNLTYVLNDGTLETENPSTYKVTDESFTLNNPTKPGYTFTGWTLTKLNVQEQPAGTPNTTLTIEKGTTGDREYTANWELSTGKVIVHHYEQGTTTPVAQDEEIVSIVGQTYTVTNLISDTNKIFVGTEEKEETREYLDPNKYEYVTVERNKENTTIGTTEEEIANGTVSGTLQAAVQEITYYYSINRYTITGEVVGGNGTISDITETVEYGESSTQEIRFTPNNGYRVEKIMLYTGDEVDGTYGTEEDGGIEIVDYSEDSRTQIVTMPIFTNVIENKHIVVTFEERPIVAQIVAVPQGSETMKNPNGDQILNNTYYTLEDAINDAALANENPGEVEIKILADVRDESVIIEDGNNVVIDLNGFTINSNDEDAPTITVMESTLVVKDESKFESGKILSRDGIGIYITPNGECTLGIDGDIVSASTPTVEGAIYGIYKEVDGEQEGILNYYDGKVIGGTTAFAGSTKIDDRPLLYDPSIVTENGKQIAVLAIVSNVEAVIGKARYIELEDAFAAVEANPEYNLSTPVEIDVVDEVTIEAAIQVSMYKNIVLDLNGHAVSGIQANNVMQNAGKLEIKDSTAQVDEDEKYLELVQNGTYYFEKVGDHLEANNYGVDSSVANSYIEINLEQELPENEFELKINANISSDSGDNGFIEVTNTQDAPVVSSTNKLIYVSGLGQPKDYTKTLIGGQKYYVHFGYSKNASKSMGVDTLMVNSITLNGQDVLAELKQPKGVIELSAAANTIYNKPSGELVVNNAQITNKNTSTYYATIYNDGNLQTNDAKILTQGARTIYNLGIAELNGGLNIGNINNQTSGTLTINGDIRAYVTNTETITNTGNLIINNGIITSYSTSSICVSNTTNAKSLEINNGKFVGGKGLVNSSPVVTINNGTFINNSYCIDNSSQTGTITINNAKMRSNGTAMYNCYNSTLYIKDCTIEAVSAIRNYSGNTKNNPIVIIDNATMVTSGETLENSGTITINGGSFTSTSDYVINNCYDYGYTIVNINGGTFESKTTYALYNSVSIGTFNIGTKNTEGNKQISETNPTIKSAKSGVYSCIGIVNMYDGQIIAPVGQTIHGGFKEIETTDLDGNKLDINISQITENEVQYDRLTLQPIQEPVAKILKTSEGLNLIDLVENEDYTQDDEYYYFYNLNDAVSACSEIAEDNVTKIEILKNIITQKNITILEGQNVEIALNGKQINAYVGKEFINNNGTLKITNGVSEEQKGKITNMNTVIINNGKLDTEVDIKNNDIYSAVRYGSNLPNNYEPYKTTITNNGQLTVNGGIIETEGTGVAIRNINELIINDGTINALKVENNAGSYCISNKGNATCTINGGTLYCNGGSYNPVMCIRNLDNASIKMNGGSIIGAAPAIYNQSSRLSEDGINEPAVYITGGTINVGSNYCAIQTSLQSEVWIKQAENSEVLMQSRIDMQGKLIIDGGTFQKEVTNSSATKISIKNAIMNERLTIAYSNSEILENEYEIVNSEIKSIFINSNGGLKIIDSKIGMSGTSDLAVISNNNTTITIENSSIYFNRSGYSAITNNAGTIIIPSVGETTIESVNSTCINNTNTGTIIIGTKDGTVSQEYPKILSADYGVYNSNGTLNFYDGMITGKTSRSIYGNIKEVEPGYNVVIIPNNTKETAILEQVATVKIEKTSIDENNLVDNYVTITDVDGTEYYGFYSIEDAALSCTDNVKTTIVCMSESTYTQTSDAQVIPENKDIVLDLAGYKLNIAKDEGITNNGRLEIIDSSTSKTGIISATADMPIVNNGDLTITETTIQNTQQGNSEDYATVIQNAGTLKLNESTLRSIGSYSICINNIGNVEIEGGTLDGKKDDTTIYAINNAGTGIVECNLTKFNNTWIGNKEQGTMEFIDVDMSTRVGIINYGTSVYEENVSKPAIRIKGGEICTSSYIRSDMIYYGFKNYAGEMILENNEETSVDLHIYNNHGYSIRYTDIINEGGLITVNSGAIEQNFVNNSGTIQIKGGTIEGDITNKENAIFNIYGGTFTDKKNSKYCIVTNNGSMNIGKDDGTIEVNSPMFEYTQNGSKITSYEELNYYDGTICIQNNMPINEAINKIPVNSTIIYTKDDTINKYTLSDSTVIATIDDEPYYKLQSAIDACTAEENKVIKLETSIALIEGQELDLEDKNVTIDLNNNTIIGNVNNTLITTAGKLEIVDNSESKNGKIYSYGGKLIYNSGELKIANGTFEVVGYKRDRITIENVGTGTIDISGGTFNANPVTSEYNKCTILLSTSTGDIQISGGTFNFNVGAEYRVYRAIDINNENTELKPKVTITGEATINSVQYVTPLQINNIDLEISGGTINAVANSTIQNSTVLITGGTVTGKLTFSNSTLSIKDTPTLDAVIVSTNSVAKIESGIFNGRLTNSNTTEIVGGEFYGGITNNGTMTIKNALINTEGTNAITTGQNSKLDLLENVTIASNYSETIYAYSGTLNIYENITINNTYSSTSEAAGIYIHSATVNIQNNVTIKVDNGKGIYMIGGTLNLGEKDFPVSKELPSITGSTYGIYKENGTFNFYDGILKGGTQALYGTVSNTPDLYSVTYADDTQTTAYLSIIPTVERVAKVGDLYYNTIEGAIEAIVNSGGTGKIDIAKDIVLSKTLVIPSGSNITIDLQAHTISYASDTDTTIQIETGATLIIIDSIEDGTSAVNYGAVQNVGGTAIKNKGTLNIGDNLDGTMYKNSPRIIGTGYAIENAEGAVFNFYDGILKGVIGVYNASVEPTIPEGYSLQEGIEVINETLTYITKYLVIQ